MFWQNPLNQTVSKSIRLAKLNPASAEDIRQWFDCYSDVEHTTSNAGSSKVPFQRWFHFKEAFSPKFVADTISDVPYSVETCLDPFGGSGTTAVTARFLGIESISIELNPFLPDLIEAKTTPIAASRLLATYEAVVKNLRVRQSDKSAAESMPATFREPGVNERYIFDAEVFDTAQALLRRINEVNHKATRRLLKILLGSVLVDSSNVIINGKGRRYRKNWEERAKTADDLIRNLDAVIDVAVADLIAFAGLPKIPCKVIRGDARKMLKRVERADVAIFSPPYPNSFDYTDVYNLELWMLGYLCSATENRRLRAQTLRSHVQYKWDAPALTLNSPTLGRTLTAISGRGHLLWNKGIPNMIVCYFADLRDIFVELRRILPRKKRAIVAIGDSQYVNVVVDVAQILDEVVRDLGFKLIDRGAIRSMRNSSQHGGDFDLSEHCLVFERC